MTKKIRYISLASFVAALSVLLLHANGCFWSYSTESYWFSANIIESLFYFAVPVFFMITGATNMDYREKYTTKVFLKKRFKKTLIPFLCWNIIGLAYNVLCGKSSLEDISFVQFILQLLENRIVYIYWFFWPLFGIYFSIPFISFIPKEIRVRSYNYILLLSLIFNVSIPFLVDVFGYSISFPITISVGFEYLFYVLAGWTISNSEYSPIKRMSIYCLGIAGLLVHAIGTYKLSNNAGCIVETYKGYYKLPCVVYSIAVFLFIKQVAGFIKNDKIWAVIETLASYTFPVYLMHIYFIWVIPQFGFDNHSLTYRLIIPFVVYPICMTIAYVVRKIPIIRYLLP